MNVVRRLEKNLVGGFLYKVSRYDHRHDLLQDLLLSFLWLQKIVLLDLSLSFGIVEGNPILKCI
jgi:hypothetical protein